MAFDYLDSDSSYDEATVSDGSTSCRKTMKLRKTSRIKRPVRYRDDLEPVDPGRPLFVHQDPVFNMDRAKFVQWRSLRLDEPSPGEAQYKMWKELGEPRDEFGAPVTPPSTSHGHARQAAAESPGPTVAHLRRQSNAGRPGLSQPVVESIEQRDMFDEVFEANLADFEDDEELRTDDDNESVVIHPPLSSAHQDWPALSEKVQWAIIYDLAHDHEDGITAAANLVGLALNDVIKFVNVYVREKTLWENSTHQAEPVRPAVALFQLDGQHPEVEQPVPEAETDQVMRNYEPERRDVRAGASQTVTDADVDIPIPEGVRGVWHEPEVESFHKADTQVVAEKEAGQFGAETAADQIGTQADDEQLAPVAWPPVVELITDSFSREDIGSGRSFLTFVGLQEYADRFSGWFGRGTTFREIPGIFDEKNEFIFSTEDTKNALYSGNEFAWQGPAPQLEKGPAQREWLMEALPQDTAQSKWPDNPPLEQFQALAERVHGRPIELYDKNERFFDQVPEGGFGGSRYGERAPAAALVNSLANDKSHEKDAGRLTREDADGHVGRNADRRNNNKPKGADENVRSQVMLGESGDDGARLFNTSSAMQLCPKTPRFDNVIARRSLEMRHVGVNEGYNARKSVPPTYPPPFPHFPPFLQPHQGILHPADKAVPTPPSLGHNSSHVASRDQASRALTSDSLSATSNTMPSRLIKTSLKPDGRNMAEKDTHDAKVTVEPASGEAVNNAAQRNAPVSAESGLFTENGIEVRTFPKCYSCFKVRARCNGGRPCSSCVNRNRKCRPATKAELDELPERAERVVRDKAKADGKAAQAEGPGMVRAAASTPNTALSVLPASHTAGSGADQKQSAMAGGASTDEGDSDLDNFPPEKEDPKDSDYDCTPKKKRPKKGTGNTSIGKKQSGSQVKLGVPATPTPATKKRGPYRKKGNTFTPKRNEPVVGTTSTPTVQSGGSISAGSVVTAPSAQKPSEKAPAAGKDKFPSLSRNTGEGGFLGAGAGRSVYDAVEGVGHAGGEFGVTNARPAPVGKRNETPSLSEAQSVLDPSLFSPSLSSGAEDSRYLDIPFAPINQPAQIPTHQFVPGTPMTQVSRSFAGLTDAAIRVSPSREAHPMPVARSHFVPPRPRTLSAENDHIKGAELPNTSSGLKTPMALQKMLPVTADRMPLAPQIDLPGLNSFPGDTEISPRSQSSSSGTTVSMDFLRMHFSPSQDSPGNGDRSVSGRVRRSSSDHQSMLGISPGFSAGVVPVDSPTASQRRHPVSLNHNGSHNSGTSFPSPMMGADEGIAMAPGLMSPYAMFQQQRPIPRPFSRMQQGPTYPVLQEAMYHPGPSNVFHDPRTEELRLGSRGVGTSPARQDDSTAHTLPAKRQADAPWNTGPQPVRKKPRAHVSPLAPPREAGSWKELARSQWATETQENQP